MNKLNCMDYLVDSYFGLDVQDFQNLYFAEPYPTILRLVEFVSEAGYFIGAGAVRFDPVIKTNFDREKFPLLIIVQAENSLTIDHGIIYDKGRVYDIAGRDMEYYKDKIIGIYPINKLK